MASKIVYDLIDDLSGEVIADGRGEALTFALDGVSYEIDLELRNAAKLRSDLEPWLGRARRSGGRQASGARGRSVSSGLDPKAVRAWARSNGVTVPAKGRVSAAVVEQYRAAGN